MEAAQVITLVLSSGAATAILPPLVKKIAEAFTGRARKRRSQIDRLYRELDRERGWRRAYQEVLTLTRLIAVKHGAALESLPPVPIEPTREKEDAPPE